VTPRRGMRSLAKRLVGEPMLGALDYWRFPERGRAWGGPFNGQTARQALFQALVTACRFQAIVETGTYLGTTTEAFADTALPVFTIEGQPRNFGFARARLKSRSNVTVTLGDSRTELTTLLDGRLSTLRDGPLFFYLDAHWDEDVPLRKEIDIISRRCTNAVIMIDDFEVAGDPGYIFDDYGHGNVLRADYIAGLVEAHALESFYPTTPSEQETGAKRGCIVLATGRAVTAELSTVSRLRSDQRPSATSDHERTHRTR
jgi:hypothetical protein